MWEVRCQEELTFKGISIEKVTAPMIPCSLCTGRRTGKGLGAFMTLCLVTSSLRSFFSWAGPVAA